MLLHRREAHRVVPGELRDALATVERPQDDVAPCGIGQCGKDVVGVECGVHYYNHMVVSTISQQARRVGGIP